MVHSTAGCELLSFLDAYSGYHQVWLAPEDKTKTSFVTPDGVYSYIQMPFGLWNAGATFARLIHSALKAQLGRNVEVASNHVADLRETFASLGRAAMSAENCLPLFAVLRGASPFR